MQSSSVVAVSIQRMTSFEFSYEKGRLNIIFSVSNYFLFFLINFFNSGLFSENECPKVSVKIKSFPTLSTSKSELENLRIDGFVIFMSLRIKRSLIE